MYLLKYIILSFLQGFTEPLPISSSGHVRILKSLFNDVILNDLNFEIIVNFGSLIAVILFYKKEILSIITDFISYIKTKNNIYKTNYNYAINIIIGTIPVTIIGFLIKDIIESYLSVRFIGFALIMTAFLLFMIYKKDGYKKKEEITIKDAIIIGFYQVIALLPGISRSGTTLVGALNQNLTRETAINYSFMLYIPVSIGSMILGVYDIINNNNLNDLLIPYSVSLVISCIVTYYSIKLFINIVKKEKLIYFSLYCLIIGMLVIFYIK